MRVFVTWSGPRAQAIAEVLGKWLKNVLQKADPFVSSESLRSGQRWFHDLAGKLEDCAFGIACVTPQNQQSEWMHFEAGAITKHVAQSALCPLLFDGMTPAQLKPPLGQFQARVFDEKDVRKLVSDIDAEMGTDGIGRDAATVAFGKWWPDLKAGIQNIPKEDAVATPRPLEDMVEEILKTVRALSTQSTALGWFQREAKKQIGLSDILNAAGQLEPRAFNRLVRLTTARSSGGGSGGTGDRGAGEESGDTPDPN